MRAICVASGVLAVSNEDGNLLDEANMVGIAKLKVKSEYNLDCLNARQGGNSRYRM